MTQRAHRRAGYTLLEMMAALTIAAILLGAVYFALNTQLQSRQAGADKISQATLARSLFNRLSADVSVAVNLSEASRFRRASQSQSGSGGSMSGSSSSTPGTSSTTPTTATSTPGTTASTSTGTSTTTTPGTSSSSSLTPSDGSTQAAGPVLPYGVMGDNSTLNLYISKLPSEVWNANPDQASSTQVSDLRRVTYWLASGGGGGDGGGLARIEIKAITSEDADPTVNPGASDEAKYVLASEVTDLKFTYFDGTAWQDSWDSTQLGADGVTPIGPPRAICVEMTVTFEPTRNRGSALEKHYRHVIAIPTANGSTTTTEGGS